MRVVAQHALLYTCVVQVYILVHRYFLQVVEQDVELFRFGRQLVKKLFQHAFFLYKMLREAHLLHYFGRELIAYLLKYDDRLFLDQRLDKLVVALDLQQVAHIREGEGLVLLQGVDDLGLLRRHGKVVLLRVKVRVQLYARLTAQLEGRRQRGIDHFSQRAHVVVSDPFEKLELGGRHDGLVIQHIEDVLGLVVSRRIFMDIGYNAAEHLLGPELHNYPGAYQHLIVHLERDAIGIELRKRQGQNHVGKKRNTIHGRLRREIEI